MITIRLGHTDSVNSVDRQNFLDVELKNTSKIGHFTNIKDTIDQYEQFKEERENCNRYRLITTINPYCTNVLFNPITEIVYAEGSKDCDAIIDDTSQSTKVKSSEVYGPSAANRVQMLQNTEYSKIGIAQQQTVRNNSVDENYVYHPGYDIFDNHIIRNTSFKIVNKLNSTGGSDTKFNTLEDFMRYMNGDTIEYDKRTKLDESSGNQSISENRNKHLYDYANILSFENGDSINANLTEENGWYGFINGSTIQSRNPTDGFNELEIGHVLNDHKSCEFIDMYPDRTLFSFTPKYNQYRNREEHNWDVILTYPHSHVVKDNYGKDYSVVQDGNCNGLLVLTAIKTISPSGETIVMLRTLTKHGLKSGDTIRFFIKRDTDTEYNMPYEKDFIVRNVGNLDNNEKNYYFYINDLDFIRMLDETTFGGLADNDVNLKVPDNIIFRFARVVGNNTSRYYIRKFRKIPNFKFRKENFSWDGYTGDGSVDSKKNYIDNYVKNNAMKGSNTYLFDKEQYKPAFETTIYTDDVTQIVFTDTIDIENLVDDRGCPVTEIYLTLLKRNKGYKEWYVDKDFRSDNVEFSHCFDKLSSGLEFSQLSTDKVNADILNLRKNNGDIAQLNSDSAGSSPFDVDVTIDTEEFFGDVVEFNVNECIEKQIQPFNYRFNTYQREHPTTSELTYHEIIADDWDAANFEVEEKYVKNESRFEGYYYQPHYRIPVREFGAIQQSQHYDINISDISPVQADGMYLKITSVRTANVTVGDIIYLCDDENNKKYDFVVSYIEDRTRFYIIPKVYGADMKVSPWKSFSIKTGGMTWIDVAQLVKPDENGDFKWCLRRKNTDIPNYAVKVGKNKYLWRPALKPGNMDVNELPEYAFANGAFYITKEINFFLKRQDPKGWNELYCKYCFPNDIPGNIKPESNYIYKEEREVIC